MAPRRRRGPDSNALRPRQAGPTALDAELPTPASEVINATPVQVNGEQHVAHPDCHPSAPHWFPGQPGTAPAAYYRTPFWKKALAVSGEVVPEVLGDAVGDLLGGGSGYGSGYGNRDDYGGGDNDGGAGPTRPPQGRNEAFFCNPAPVSPDSR